MTNVLALHSSPRPADVSVTRRLASLMLARIARTEPGVVVIERDLAAEALPHAGAALYGGLRRAANDRTPEEADAVRSSDRMIGQLRWADVLVIGAPMYNFGVPTVLKTWIDCISVPGRTFRYDREGQAQGLVTGKRAYVVTSRGGDYGGSAGLPGNHADPMVRAALALLGIVDLHVVAADGQALHPDVRRTGFDIASRRISELVPA